MTSKSTTLAVTKMSQLLLPRASQQEQHVLRSVWIQGPRLTGTITYTTVTFYNTTSTSMRSSSTPARAKASNTKCGTPTIPYNMPFTVTRSTTPTIYITTFTAKSGTHNDLYTVYMAPRHRVIVALLQSRRFC
jgi:hypothetical protein